MVATLYATQQFIWYQPVLEDGLLGARRFQNQRRISESTSWDQQFESHWTVSLKVLNSKNCSAFICIFISPFPHNSAIATHMMRWPPTAPSTKRLVETVRFVWAQEASIYFAYSGSHFNKMLVLRNRSAQWLMAAFQYQSLLFVGRLTRGWLYWLYWFTALPESFFFSRFKLFRTEVDQTRSPKEVATRAGRIRPWFLQATWHTGWQVRKWNMSLLTTKHWQGAYPPLSRFSWFFDVGEVLIKCATGFLLFAEYILGFLLKEYIYLYSYGQYIWNRLSMVLKIYWSWPFPYCP